MTFMTALAQSINIPAVKVMYLAGIGNVIDLAGRMGITTLGDVRDYGLSLALGAGEVRLLDLTSAFGVFAADGVRHPPVGILKVESAAGKVLEEYEPSPEQVIDTGVARDISFMLSNNEARIGAYSSNNPFNFPGHDVAAKTGTTNDSKDFWVVGYTPYIAVGVWAGNNDPAKPTVREIAGYVVSPMWREFMEIAIAHHDEAEFFGEPRPVPANAPLPLRGIYTTGNEGDVHEILYFVNKDAPLIPGNSINDPQYPYWEYALRGFSRGTSTDEIDEDDEETAAERRERRRLEREQERAQEEAEENN
jgi:membrane peptidoglycan carboxypeptidase